MSSNLRVAVDQIGPWSQGLYKTLDSITDDTAAIGPNELVELENMLVDERGVVYPRPGIWKAFPGTNLDLTSATSIRVLGKTNISGGVEKLLVNVYKSGVNNRVGIVNSFGNTITFYNDFGAGGVAFNAVFTYNGKVYLVPNQTNTAPTLSSLAYWSNGGAWTSMSLPGGLAACVLKDRIFIFSADNTIWWSKATDPATWAAPDGGFAKLDSIGTFRTMFVFNNIIYIIGEQKIVTMSFTADPAIDGIITTILDNTVIQAATFYNGAIYLFMGNGLATLANGYVIPIFTKQFAKTPMNAGAAFLCAIGDYLVISIVDESQILSGLASNITNTYILNLQTGSLAKISHIMADVFPLGLTGDSIARSADDAVLLIGAKDTATNKWALMKMQFSNETSVTLDTDADGNIVAPLYRLKTRQEIRGNPFEFKYLKWFGYYASGVFDALDATPTITLDKIADNNVTSEVKNLPVFRGFEKADHTSQRLNSLRITFNKAQTALASRTLDAYGQINTGIPTKFSLGPLYAAYNIEAGQVPA